MKRRTVVDLTRYQGYAQSVFLAPEMFELHGEEGVLYATAVPDDQAERVRQAAAACPVQTIPLREEVSSVPGDLKDGRTVVIGVSLAGLRAAEAL